MIVAADAALTNNPATSRVSTRRQQIFEHRFIVRTPVGELKFTNAHLRFNLKLSSKRNVRRCGNRRLERPYCHPAQWHCPAILSSNAAILSSNFTKACFNAYHESGGAQRLPGSPTAEIAETQQEVHPKPHTTPPTRDRSPTGMPRVGRS
jgi:hypothetical protein